MARKERIRGNGGKKGEDQRKTIKARVSAGLRVIAAGEATTEKGEGNEMMAKGLVFVVLVLDFAEIATAKERGGLVKGRRMRKRWIWEREVGVECPVSHAVGAVPGLRTSRAVTWACDGDVTRLSRAGAVL
jgi:hypothetical protein